MNLSERHGLLLQAIRAARTGRLRRLVAGTLLFTALLLYLLLLLFPGLPSGVDPRRLGTALLERPRLAVLWLLAAGTLVGATWSLVGGAVVRTVALSFGGRAADDALVVCRQRWTALFFAPLASLIPGAFLLGMATGVASVVRIPWAGWPLILLLSPVVLSVAAGASRIVLSWLFCGHLVMPGTAIEGSTAFVSTARANAWFRRSPLLVVALRVWAAVLALFESILRLAVPAAGVAGVVLLLRATGVDPFAPAVRTLGEGFGSAGPAADLGGAFLALLLVLLGAWYAAIPVCHRIGARAGLYLLHRKEMDGIAVDAPLPEVNRPPDLQALGLELVARLRDGNGD